LKDLSGYRIGREQGPQRDEEVYLSQVEAVSVPLTELDGVAEPV
jgi:hypothetical protein